jgi:hypothetical protein
MVKKNECYVCDVWTTKEEKINDLQQKQITWEEEGTVVENGQNRKLNKKNG